MEDKKIIVPSYADFEDIYNGIVDSMADDDRTVEQCISMRMRLPTMDEMFGYEQPRRKVWFLGDVEDDDFTLS